MLRRQSSSQKRLVLVDLEEYIPSNHVLRAIKAKVDFSFVYDLAQDLYSDKGRPAVDPVVLVKMLLIGYLFGIPTERRLEQEVRLNLAYRWFLGLEIDEAVPDHSTLSQNRRRRFRESTFFQDVFDHVVKRCVEAGLVTGEVLVTDSTHIKACAGDGRFEVVRVDKTPTEYMAVLENEVQRVDEQLRAASEATTGKKKRGPRPKSGPPKVEQEEVRRSTTDSESGYMSRPGKPSGFHYLNHMTVDPQVGIITDVYVTPGNVNDHLPCPSRIASQKQKFGLNIRWLGADKGYDYLNVHYGLHQLEITPLIPSIQREQGQGSFGPFTYESDQDRFICPAGKVLTFVGVDRTDKAKTYYAKRADCRTCEHRGTCLPKHKPQKFLRRAIHQHLAEAHHRMDGSPLYRTVQRLRRIWCEGTFALLKAKHNLRTTYKRGIVNVTEQCLLSALAVNLTRYVRCI